MSPRAQIALGLVVFMNTKKKKVMNTTNPKLGMSVLYNRKMASGIHSFFNNQLNYEVKEKSWMVIGF